MPPAPSLLEQLQGLIERTYAYESDRPDVGAFLIGDEGARVLYGLEDADPMRARLLVRVSEDGRIRARLYYPDGLVRLLECQNPLRGIHSGNVDALATLIEELDHLLLLADRAHRGATASLLELELQANITKTLVLRKLLRLHLGRPLGLVENAWVRWHVLEKGRFDEPKAEVRRRYRDARRLARAVLGHIDQMAPPVRLRWLRRLAPAPGEPRHPEAALLAA